MALQQYSKKLSLIIGLDIVAYQKWFGKTILECWSIVAVTRGLQKNTAEDFSSPSSFPWQADHGLRSSLSLTVGLR